MNVKATWPSDLPILGDEYMIAIISPVSLLPLFLCFVSCFFFPFLPLKKIVVGKGNERVACNSLAAHSNELERDFQARVKKSWKCGSYPIDSALQVSTPTSG